MAHPSVFPFRETSQNGKVTLHSFPFWERVFFCSRRSVDGMACLKAVIPRNPPEKNKNREFRKVGTAFAGI
jgi:hypothetical protein